MKQLTFIFLILFCLQTFAENPLFLKGNEEYTKGNYSNATSLYDSIILNNLESSELYYNLGNCYYQTQDWANAIWYYEKSLKLNPNNEGAIHNLQLTNLRIIDRIEALPKLFYKRWWENLIDMYTTKIWQILTMFCVWIALIIQLLNRLTNYQTKYLLASFNTLVLILFCITYSSFQKSHSKSQAIIFASSVIVNSAPTDNSTNLFSLHSGAKIEIIDQIGNWINIKLANGNIGWIKESNCKHLN